MFLRVRLEMIFSLGYHLRDRRPGKICKSDSLTRLSDHRSDSEQRLIVKEITSIAKILSSFHTLSDPYLESVGWYFTDEVEEKIQKVDKGQLSPGGYILWVIEQVEEETKRAKECLDGDVAISAVKIVQFEAGFKRRDQIIRKGKLCEVRLADCSFGRRDGRSRSIRFETALQIQRRL